jgi:hypothetical protein
MKLKRYLISLKQNTNMLSLISVYVVKELFISPRFAKYVRIRWLAKGVI